ncbi:MAG: DNA-formamidopyrimidine glycosylase family protein [bacterium]|jgi:formamidopyrimidine-DNA glycosylase
MPELPEATTISYQLKNYLNLSKNFNEHYYSKVVLKKINIYKNSIIKNIELSNELVNKNLEEISNYGKIVYFKFSDNYWVLFHLALTGALLIKELLNQDKLNYFEKYKIIEFIFIDNNEKDIKERVIFFSAKRLFEKIVFIKDSNPFKKYGPPFNKLKPMDFINILSKVKKPIKVALMDQGLISGIGNIYAIESLFCAKISPLRKANDITIQEYYKLYNCLKEILKESIKNRGSTISDYVDALGQYGNYQNFHKIYNKPKCFECNSKTKRIKLEDRITYYCPNCQK